MSDVKRYLVTRGSEVSEMVYASDYDRDTQALKDELDNIKRSWGLILSQRDALAAERSWAETELPKWRDLAKETRIERDELRAQVEVTREALEFAAKSLANITSSDGSGHADIALSVLRLAGMNADERETLVEGWKEKAQWRIDAALQGDKT